MVDSSAGSMFSSAAGNWNFSLSSVHAKVTRERLFCSWLTQCINSLIYEMTRFKIT